MFVSGRNKQRESRSVSQKLQTRLWCKAVIHTHPHAAPYILKTPSGTSYWLNSFCGFNGNLIHKEHIHTVGESLALVIILSWNQLKDAISLQFNLVAHSRFLKV